MSDEVSNEEKYKNHRRIGKMRGTNTRNGVLYKIYMDNLDHQNKDGTPNKYYLGALIWADAATGKNYHVKQMSLWVPKAGMDPKLVEKGYSHFITLNLGDAYEVTLLG